MLLFDDLTDERLSDFGFIRAHNKKPCSFCGTPTEYIDYVIESRVCPNCLDKLQELYKELSEWANQVEDE